MAMDHILDQKIVTELSLAVSLKDDFTQKNEVLGSVKVTIPDLNITGVENLSYYYNFWNITAGSYSILVDSDYYVKKEETGINLPIAITTSEDYVKEITILPNHLYHFPRGTTLVRGCVRDFLDNPIANAKIEWVGESFTTLTSDKGDFVIYFDNDQADATIQVKVTPQGKPSKTVNGDVKRGKTTSLLIVY